VKLLLDTNAYTHFRRGSAAVREEVQLARELVLSSVVLGEILFGFRNGTRMDANERLLRAFLAEPRVSVLHVTETTADRYSRICTILRGKGKPIPSNDAWIAAHALESGAVLLSFDSHFEAIDGLAWKLLAVPPSA
jgi:tRNA(fMet)-specific endonuclease VapC